jgi:methionyl-tRNA formyltransferase
MAKVIVMGYHNIGCRCLKLLVSRGITVAAVFTHADDPKEVCWFQSMPELAKSLDIPVYVPEDPNTPEWISRIQEIKPDVIFSFYYRKMVSQKILDIPRYGAINMHGSLLPKYRGRSPVNWQILHGETEGGVTLHYMVRQADAGDIIGRKKVPIGPDETALEVFTKLEPAAEALLGEHVDKILTGTAPRYAQDPFEATYFGGRKPEDGKIIWESSAQDIHNLVRAVTIPYPGAFGFLHDKKIMVWRTKWRSELPQWQSMKPGTVFTYENQLWIKAGQGVLLPLEISESEKGQPMIPSESLLKNGDVLT